MKLQEAIKGMAVESWERREYSSGKCKVYVRFAPKKPTVTINEEEAATGLTSCSRGRFAIPSAWASDTLRVRGSQAEGKRPLG